MAKSPFSKEAQKPASDPREQAALQAASAVVKEFETEKKSGVAVMDEPAESNPGVGAGFFTGRYRVHYAANEKLWWEGEAESPEAAYLAFARHHGIVVFKDPKTGMERVLADHQPVIEAV